jgi:hypothetical protein
MARRLRGADPQRVRRLLPTAGPLLLGAIAIAFVRHDFVGIALSIIVPVVALVLLIAFAPDRWFVTGAEARHVTDRWEKRPIIGPLTRLGRRVGGYRTDDEEPPP